MKHGHINVKKLYMYISNTLTFRH